MRFIDLFAGLGGFHKALSEMGHTCVFASELNPQLRELYKTNWHMEEVAGDIRSVNLNSIPDHDILCAGFPCQPFSKAGKQLGLNDQERGTLFDEIVKILDFHKPTYFILENVPFIAKHDNEETWNYMKSQLDRIGYAVDKEIFSPHDFGIPQHRHRIFIIGKLISKGGLPKESKLEDVKVQSSTLRHLSEFLDHEPRNAKVIPKRNQECINLWQELLFALPKELRLPGFPIWGMEFGATYPYEENYPLSLPCEELKIYKGNFGVSLNVGSREELIKRLPSYARVESKFPSWKKNYIKNSRKFYSENEKYIDRAVSKLAKYESQSWQKLEWNSDKHLRNIHDHIIQFRASGIRIKKPDFFPSLVCTSTQVPIIGWQSRYITREEGLRLQALEGVKLPENDNAAFHALGNAVNAKIVTLVAEHLFSTTNNIVDKAPDKAPLPH